MPKGNEVGGEREIYQGYALQAIDRKGRVAIPHALRSVVEANSGKRSLLIGDHDSHECMVAYDHDWPKRRQARLDESYQWANSQGREIDRSDDGLHNFTNVDDVSFDESGRFILPEYVMFAAKLTDVAFFAGVGEVFQIWNPKILLDTQGVREGTRKRCAFEMSKRGIA